MYDDYEKLQRHNMFLFPCIGLRQDPPGLCNTLIGIALDMGPATFLCPVCKTLYVVDPIKQDETDALPLGEGVTVMERHDGHRVEIFGSKAVRAMRGDWDGRYRTFMLEKVGSLERNFNAVTLSAPGESPW